MDEQNVKPNEKLQNEIDELKKELIAKEGFMKQQEKDIKELMNENKKYKVKLSMLESMIRGIVDYEM